MAIKEHSGLLLSHDGPRNVDELCQVFFATASDSGEVDERMQANRRMMSPATNFFDKKTMLSRWLETFEDAEARLGTSTVRERFLCLAALTIMLFDNHGAMTINVFLEEVALLLHKLWPILSASPAENGRVFFSLLSPSSPMAKHWATALVDWVALSHEMIKNHHNTVVEEPAIAPLPPKQDDNDDEREREQDVSEEPVKPEATAASGATADKENMALPWIIFTMFISWREKGKNKNYMLILCLFLRFRARSSAQYDRCLCCRGGGRRCGQWIRVPAWEGHRPSGWRCVGLALCSLHDAGSRPARLAGRLLDR